MLGMGGGAKGQRVEVVAFLRTIQANEALPNRMTAVLGARNAGFRGRTLRQGERVEKDTAPKCSNDCLP